jgi:hypothetical protein
MIPQSPISTAAGPAVGADRARVKATGSVVTAGPAALRRARMLTGGAAEGAGKSRR